MTAMTVERQERQEQAPPAVIRRPASGISIDPAKLAWYRESRGWSRQRLSREIAKLRLIDEETGEVITVSRDAIAKNENGERKPKSSTVQAYCAALSTEDYPVLPRHLLPGGTPLPPHQDAEERRERLALNRQLRAFARKHGIQYRNPVSGRVYYSRPLRDAFALADAGAPADQVAAAIAKARTVTDIEPADSLTGQDSIAELDLAVRTHNALIRAEVHTISDLAGHSAGELLGPEFRDFGRTSLAEVRERLKGTGFALRGDEPDSPEDSADAELLAS